MLIKKSLIANQSLPQVNLLNLAEDSAYREMWNTRPTTITRPGVWVNATHGGGSETQVEMLTWKRFFQLHIKYNLSSVWNRFSSSLSIELLSLFVQVWRLDVLVFLFFKLSSTIYKQSLHHHHGSPLPFPSALAWAFKEEKSKIMFFHIFKL